MPEINDLSKKINEEIDFEEIEEESGVHKKQLAKIFSKNNQRYGVYTNKFDEYSKAEDLETTEELTKLRVSLDQQLLQLKCFISKLANEKAPAEAPT